MSLMLAVDVGALSARAGLIDAEGRRLAGGLPPTAGAF